MTNWYPLPPDVFEAGFKAASLALLVSFVVSIWSGRLEMGPGAAILLVSFMLYVFGTVLGRPFEV